MGPTGTSALSRAQQMNSTGFSLASDPGIPSANQRQTRVLPIGAGASGGMRNTQESNMASMWMNPVDGPPRPGGLYQGSVAQ